MVKNCYMSIGLRDKDLFHDINTRDNNNNMAIIEKAQIRN